MSNCCFNQSDFDLATPGQFSSTITLAFSRPLIRWSEIVPVRASSASIRSGPHKIKYVCFHFIDLDLTHNGCKRRRNWFGHRYPNITIFKKSWTLWVRSANPKASRLVSAGEKVCPPLSGQEQRAVPEAHSLRGDLLILLLGLPVILDLQTWCV